MSSRTAGLGLHRPKASKLCVVCGTANTQKCARCRMVSYCCREHQAQDWPEHKQHCKGVVGISRISIDSFGVYRESLRDNVEVYDNFLYKSISHAFYPDVPRYMKELVVWKFFSPDQLNLNLNQCYTPTTWGLLHDCVGERDFVGLEVLLMAGADPNQKTSGNGLQPNRAVTRCTPLFQSARLNCIKSAKMLLAAGADPRIGNLLDQTPLDSCISVEMLDLLESHGADPGHLSYDCPFPLNGRPVPSGTPKTYPLLYSLVSNFFNSPESYRDVQAPTLEELDAVLRWCEARGMRLSLDFSFMQTMRESIEDKPKFLAWLATKQRA